MNVAFELPPAQSEKLRQLAEQDDAFHQATEKVPPEEL
jgi:hypothetical protein